jgi:capsular polysaccharide biosynthesis protein
MTLVDRWRRRLRAVARRLRNRISTSRSARRARAVRNHPLAPYTSVLPQRSPRVVAVLASGVDDHRSRPWLVEFGRDTVHMLEDPGTAHEQLVPVGPVDVLLDLRSGPDVDHAAAWRRLFFHVRAGGAYVIGRAGDPGFGSSTRAWAAAVLDAGDLAAKAGFGAREYAAATASVLLTPDAVIFRKQVPHLLKLRDAQTNRILPTREPALRMTELATLPAGAFPSRARVTMHEAAVAVEPMPARISYPELHLRHFEGRLAFRGATLLHGEHTILPESFRWHLAKNPSNPRTINSSPAFARLPSDDPPRETLSGTFYMVDPQYGGFGHLLTEMVGRLWGWDQAKQADPDLKAIFSVVRPRATAPQPKHRLLRAYGIAEQDIVWVDKPVYLTSLISPTSMWHNHVPYYAHPNLTEVWDRMRASLADPDAPSYKRIFVSRSQLYERRTCRNAAQVEELFAAHGFTIIYPEQLDLGTQVAIFSTATTIAGFGGSALFNVMFTRDLQTMIVLNHDSYQHRNEHLYTSVLGGDVHYFWSPADIPQPAGGVSLAATESSWEFDFRRHGAALTDLLGSL